MRAIAPLTLGQAEAPLDETEPRYACILLAYDGSPSADDALAWAADLALAHDASVIVASACPTPALAGPYVQAYGWYAALAENYAEMEAQMRRASDDAAATLTQRGVRATARFLSGSPTREIARLAREERADLLVIGAGKGSHGAARLGRVASGLLHQAPCSILFARGSPDARRVLAATDGSRASARAVALALRFASAKHAELAVLHVLDRAHVGDPQPSREGLLKAVTEHLHLPEAPSRVRYLMDAGDPPERILQHARDESADLVVVGAHGKGLVERLTIGSTSGKVVQDASCSVLVVRLA